MDTKNIIQQGERAKYIVKSQRSDFDFENENFVLEILFGMLGKKIIIHKNEFLHFGARFGFSFPTNQVVGPVIARLIMEIPDTDCPNRTRQEVDEQVIAFVATSPFLQFYKCHFIRQEQKIIYERTEESSIEDRYVRLCDTNSIPLRIADGGFLFAFKSSNH